MLIRADDLFSFEISEIRTDSRTLHKLNVQVLYIKISILHIPN